MLYKEPHVVSRKIIEDNGRLYERIRMSNGVIKYKPICIQEDSHV
jgi:hypothetical protein